MWDNNNKKDFPQWEVILLSLWCSCAFKSEYGTNMDDTKMCFISLLGVFKHVHDIFKYLIIKTRW